MSGSKGLIDKKVTELVSEIYNRVDGRGVLAGSALAEALEIADAALRRAKVEVWREAATVHRQADGNDCKYCLARAAQIEEGE